MKRGFTILELMIVLAIIGIIVAIAIPVITGKASSSTQDWQYGINGVTETRCIDGYKFVIGERGRSQQILNDKGGGVACSN